MSKSILFVDDEEEIRDLMKINFESTGIELETASSGNEALQILKSKKFDMVISDVKMANGSGVDLLQALRETDFDAPFVFLTAYLDLDSKKLLKLGALKVFYKPTPFSELEAFIRSTLGLD